MPFRRGYSAKESKSVTARARPNSIRAILDRIYAKYNRREFVGTDPLQFAYRYADRRDVEIVAFVAAALAYGRVEQIHRSLENLFARMGRSPHDFVASWTDASRRHLAGFKHRFTTGDDIGTLFLLFRPVLREHGSLEDFFLQGYDPSEANIVPALTRFCDRLCASRQSQPTAGWTYLLASPARGSASKRLSLFLRWMVRKDDVDLGLWTSIDQAKLIVPVDVHVARLCRLLGFHDAGAVSLSTALKITAAFARIEPTDPVKYDFSLSRIGIVGACTGRCRPECLLCDLAAICRRTGPPYTETDSLSNKYGTRARGGSVVSVKTI
jgi:uncharacterized protein (TIGR02757 family)